jgi:hypothetical protein
VLILRDRDSGEALFSWSPCGDPLRCFTFEDGGVSDVADPFSLNQTISCGPGACEKSFAVPGTSSTTFHIAYDLQAGQRYAASLFVAEHVRVGVPAPATLTLLVSGLAAAGVVAMRSRGRAA